MLTACATCVRVRGVPSGLLRLCIRDVSAPAAAAAGGGSEARHQLHGVVAGASGVIVLADSGSVSAGDLSASLRAAVAAASPAVPLPLLVLTSGPESNNARSSNSTANDGSDRILSLQNGGAGQNGAGSGHNHEATSDAVARGLQSGGSCGAARVSAVKVVSLSRHGGGGGEASPSEAALLEGLAWLTEHAPTQPQLWVRLLPCAAPWLAPPFVKLAARVSAEVTTCGTKSGQ